MCKNPAMALDIVRENSEHASRYWSRLSINPAITWKVVQEYFDRPWDWTALSANPNITFGIVQQNPQICWNWTNLSRNPNITSQIVRENVELPWDWYMLSYNKNITFDLVQEYPDKPWDWDRIVMSMGVTWPNIIKILRMKDLSRNVLMWTSPALFEPTNQEIFDFVRKRHAARVICRAILRAVTDPRFEYCKRRLTKEFMDIISPKLDL